MFAKVLVANRGEVALRIVRALHDLGLPSVAVYADDDAASPHVQAADEAVALGACRTCSVDSENRPQRGQF
ncbi:MAG: biotin carboxylase N-terminal domain-containing protein, partial [Acidovorax sp.]|uniref:biotin carboxylase N-terminal domain-containing protein n=1 Tax=Acidovorax sp. TaxID=1872122 RepID=UPI00391C7683